MWYLRSAWRKVKRSTIRNCFRHAGFGKSEEAAKEEQDEETDSSVIEEANKKGIVSESLFEEYVSIDNEVLTSDVTTDEDILNELKQKNITHKIDDEQDGEEQDADTESQDLISINEAATALKTVQKFLMQQENASRTLNNVDEIDSFIKSCYYQKL